MSVYNELELSDILRELQSGNRNAIYYSLFDGDDSHTYKDYNIFEILKLVIIKDIIKECKGIKMEENETMIVFLNDETRFDDAWIQFGNQEIAKDFFLEASLLKKTL